MFIIARYITQEISKYFGIILIVAIGIYLTVDFIEKIDNFMEAGVPMMRAGLYFIYKLPLILVQMTPLGVLLAVLITFGMMAKNNELTALRAGGVSLTSLTGPIVRCGTISAVFMIVMAEGVAPFTVMQANRIWLQEVRGQNLTMTRQKDIWLKNGQSIIHLKYFQPDTQAAMGITVHRFNRQFQLVERTDASTATFSNGEWLLSKGIYQQRNAQNGRMDVSLFDEKMIQMDLTPADLAQAAPQTEEMSFLQLYRYIQKVEAEGYDATHFRVDLHAKIAFPFFCIIMSLMGAGLAAGGRMKEGLAISITYGIGIAFVYWIGFSFGVSLGYAGMLPPMIAAWGVNFISFCLAGYLLLAAD